MVQRTLSPTGPLSMEKADDDTSQSHFPQHKALSKTPPPPNDAPQSGLVSRLGDIASRSVTTPQGKNESTYPGSRLADPPRTPQKGPSDADFTREAPSRDDSQGVTPTTSIQPLGSRDSRLVGNLTTAGPLTGPKSRPRVMKHKDTSESKTAPKARSQGGQPLISTDDAQRVAVQPTSSSKSSSTPTSKEGRTPPRDALPPRAPKETSNDTRAGELVEGNQSPLPKADLSREGNTIKPHAQQVDRIASAHPQPKPSNHPTASLNQLSASVTLSPSSSTPAITKTGSSLIRAARSDARAGLAPSELPRPSDEVKGQAYPNELSHTRPSASSREPPFPTEHVASAVNADSLALPRIQGNDGVERGAKRSAETLTPDKEGKRTTALNEPKIHQEDRTTDTDTAQRRKPESSTPSTHASDIKRQPKAPPQSSVGPTSSSGVGRGYDLGATHLPDSSESGGNTGRSDAISSLRTTEASVTPQVSLSTQNQAKLAVSTPPNNKPTSSRKKSPPRPPTVVGDSQIVDSPFLSWTTPSLGSVPITPITSQEAEREGEIRPGTITPSKPLQSVGQPGSAAGHSASRNAPPTKTLPATGDDTPSKLPDYHHHTETRNPSLVQLDSSLEAKNRPHAKPIDHAQPSAHAVPSNMGKERGSQAQPGHPIPQLQHSQREGGGITPDQQHRTDPLITKQTEIPSSERAATIEVPSFPHFRPVIAYVPVHPDEISNPERSPPPPPYESSLSPGAPVVQEATPSRSGTRISSEVRDEPKKLPASLVLEVPHHPDDPGHMDRSGELKQLLFSTRDDAVAAVCPPPDHPQDVEVYRSDRSQMASARGVRQFAALSSPKMRDRSRSGSSAEQDDDTITIPPTLEKPHDLPIIDIQEVESHGTGSFDDEDRGRRPRAKSEEDGQPGQKDDDARGSQVSLKQRVPQVRVIPPTPRTSVVSPEILRPAHSDIPPVPIRPASTSLPGPPSPPRSPARSRPAESSPRRKKKGILGRICPCFGR